MIRARSLEKARAYDQFCEAWATKYKAVDCLRKDGSRLFSFYAFPAAHWVHLRTSNPIESTCATVGCGGQGCGSGNGDSDDVWEVGARGRKPRRLMGMTALATYPSRCPVHNT